MRLAFIKQMSWYCVCDKSLH